MLQSKQFFFMKKGFVVFLSVLMLVAILGGCAKKSDKNTAQTTTPTKQTTNTDPNVVATYKGGQISKEELATLKSVMSMNPNYAQLVSNPSFQEQLIKQVVAFKVLSAKADDQMKKDVQPKVKTQMDQFLKSATKDQIDQLLKKLNLSKENLQKYIEQSLLVDAVLNKQVTEQQVKDEYSNTLKKDKHAFDVATVSHILIGLKDTAGKARTKEDALKRANEVEAKLKQGGDFAKLAKEYSDDPGSKDNGGTYKDADIQQWVPEFKKAVEELPLNKISDPVQTQYGYHIIKVESRKAKTYDQMKVTLRNKLVGSKFADFMTKELPKLNVQSKLPKVTQPSTTTKSS